ncbi:MAG: hypothetical protein NTV08_20390 [Verrucomicrobia bacterium]|nr:hypothetical protein [Verrucomicrobiota bacterium]
MKRNEVQLVPTPAATDTWTPIPHLELVTQVEHTIRANGLAVRIAAVAPCEKRIEGESIAQRG